MACRCRLRPDGCFSTARTPGWYWYFLATPSLIL